MEIKIFWYEVDEEGKDYLNLGINTKVGPKEVHE